MFKHFCMAGLLALAACVSTPAGFDSAQWRKDRRECLAQANKEAQAAATPGQKLATLSWLYPIVDSSWHDNPVASADWQQEHFQACMTARAGYPPEPRWEKCVICAEPKSAAQ